MPTVLDILSTLIGGTTIMSNLNLNAESDNVLCGTFWNMLPLLLRRINASFRSFGSILLCENTIIFPRFMIVYKSGFYEQTIKQTR